MTSEKLNKYLPNVKAGEVDRVMGLDWNEPKTQDDIRLFLLGALAEFASQARDSLGEEKNKTGN